VLAHARMAIRRTPPEVRPLIRSYLSDTEERAWLGLLETHERLVRELDRVLFREHSLPLKTFETLIQIAHAPDEQLAILDLAEQVMLSPSRMSRLVMELERDGVVERHRNPADGRSTFTSITTNGKQRLAKAAPTYLTTIRRLLVDSLSPAQINHLAAIWDRAADTATAKALDKTDSDPSR
jgi:DNA-binding MarR family transcriptional regulator